jgi:hypothetical protein
VARRPCRRTATAAAAAPAKIAKFRGRIIKLAGTLVPFAYIGWSVWLVALGIGLLVTA